MKLFSLLIHNCNFAVVINHNVNTFRFRVLPKVSWPRSWEPQLWEKMPTNRGRNIKIISILLSPTWNHGMIYFKSWKQILVNEDWQLPMKINGEIRIFQDKFKSEGRGKENGWSSMGSTKHHEGCFKIQKETFYFVS